MTVKRMCTPIFGIKKEIVYSEAFPWGEPLRRLSALYPTARLRLVKG